jgi:hypothetical protein
MQNTHAVFATFQKRRIHFKNFNIYKLLMHKKSFEFGDVMNLRNKIPFNSIWTKWAIRIP